MLNQHKSQKMYKFTFVLFRWGQNNWIKYSKESTWLFLQCSLAFGGSDNSTIWWVSGFSACMQYNHAPMTSIWVYTKLFRIIWANIGLIVPLNFIKPPERWRQGTCASFNFVYTAKFCTLSLCPLNPHLIRMKSQWYMSLVIRKNIPFFILWYIVMAEKN